MEEKLLVNPETDPNKQIQTDEMDSNELCQTCGKWTIIDEKYCYGCKRPIAKCGC